MQEKDNGEVIYLVEHINQIKETSNKNKIILWADKEKTAAYDAAERLNSANIFENDYQSEFKVEPVSLYNDKKDITEIKFSMREFIKEHLDEILDKFFQKNCFCCICDNLKKCKEDFELTPCEVNAKLSKENGKKFLDSEATPDNIAKLKEIYEEFLYGEV